MIRLFSSEGPVVAFPDKVLNLWHTLSAEAADWEAVQIFDLQIQVVTHFHAGYLLW